MSSEQLKCTWELLYYLLSKTQIIALQDSDIDV